MHIEHRKRPLRRIDILRVKLKNPIHGLPLVKQHPIGINLKLKLLQKQRRIIVQLHRAFNRIAQRLEYIQEIRLLQQWH